MLWRRKRAPQALRWVRVLLYGGAAGLIASSLAMYFHLKVKASTAAVGDPSGGMVTFRGELGQRRLYDLLENSGSGPSEAAQVGKSFSNLLSPRRLYARDSYRIVRSTSGAFLHLTFVHGLRRLVVFQQDGEYRARSHRIPLVDSTRRASGAIQDSLWLSMESKGVPAEVIDLFSNIFRWSVDFLTEPRNGDRYAVLWSERQSPDGLVWGRTIETAWYEGMVTGRKVAVLFEGDYYDEEGKSLQRAFLRSPLNFRRISSHFSRNRYHPILRSYRPHHGTDYSAPSGTPVVSVAKGRVNAAGWKGGFGRLVEIQHGGSYVTRYAHLSTISRRVRKGASVRQGQVIGFVGSSGLATGAHLHFEIERSGEPRNFIALKLPFLRAVPASKKEAFEERRLASVAQLEK